MDGALRDRLLSDLGASANGLSDAEIEAKRKEHGFNEFPERQASLLKLLLSQFNDVMVYILLAAVVISVIVPILEHGTLERTELIDAVVILAIVIINAILGFVQEWRAENAIALLKKLGAPTVKVRRNGSIHIVPSRELVPGDHMLLEAGDRVSADARLIAASSLDVDESSLTGESVPVSKQVLGSVDDGGEFSTGMLYSGTLVTRGSGEAVVTAIALKTELGKVTEMMLATETPPTPLQTELRHTGKRIGILVLGLCALIFALGILKGIAVLEIFFTVVSLAVAAVPEGLPAIVTVCLALGVQRMAREHALVRKLDAIETLGSITVICADKTGTITQNRMAVSSLLLPDNGDEDLAAEVAASCNRAEPPDIGDPTEIALLCYAEEHGVKRLPIASEEVPFTSEEKYMVTLHEKEGRTVRYLKGAPEVIAKFCPKERDWMLRMSQQESEAGKRVLAVAEGSEGDVRCRGLLSMIDPPRTGVRDAIALAKRAGIRTIMITGDHPATALAIAREVGIETDTVIDGKRLAAMDTDELRHALRATSVFARVLPAHKVAILQSLQEKGEIVAMSGDGVNDAPALKRAHVGVGMGKVGTDVAREASAMVLTDDDYATIVAAIREGRRIYDNIKKFVLFLMRSNLGEVMIVSGAVLSGMPLPLLPLHILWINLVTDSFPALALAAEPAEAGLMERPPRDLQSGIFSGEWSLLILAGLLNAALALGMFELVLLRDPGNLVLARTAALTTTIVYQLLLALSTRTTKVDLGFSFFRNPWLVAAVCVSMLLHLLLLFTPVSVFFSVSPLPLTLWKWILGGALATFVLFEFMKWIKSGFPTRGSVH